MPAVLNLKPHADNTSKASGNIGFVAQSHNTQFGDARWPTGKLAFRTGYVLRSANEPFLIGT
ncbi:MAG: hypothetical protein AAFY19_00585, partial [Pseudomonadota bacterium]